MNSDNNIVVKILTGIHTGKIAKILYQDSKTGMFKIRLLNKDGDKLKLRFDEITILSSTQESQE